MEDSNTVTVHKAPTDVQVEDTSAPSRVDGQVEAHVHVEHEIWDGINLRTILAFLVCLAALLPVQPSHIHRRKTTDHAHTRPSAVS